MYTVIFDLDGTLLDTLDDLMISVNYAMQTYGLPTRSKEEVRSFIGNGAKNLIQRSAGAAYTDEILAVFQAHYKEHSADHTRPYDSIMQLLAQLKELGVCVAVLSNKPDAPTKALIKGYFGDLVQDAQGADHAKGIMEKPCPDGLFALIKRLGADKEKTVFVGDSEVDIQTANNAGLPCISVTWGFKDRAFLQASGGKIYADTPNDIFNYVGERV